jgi:hypothetical protein
VLVEKLEELQVLYRRMQIGSLADDSLAACSTILIIPGYMHAVGD